MKNNIKTISISIFLLLFSTGIAFADTMQNTCSWRLLKKADKIPVTAAALYNGGLSAYFGDSVGHIFSVNSSGVTEYNSKPATGPIDSIVETAGGNGLGNFTFTSDGRVYTHNAKDNTNTPLDLKSNTNAKLVLRYDINGGLYCTALADKANSTAVTYHYNGNNQWQAVKEQNNNTRPATNKRNNLTYPINTVQNNLNSFDGKQSTSQNINTFYNDHGRFTWTPEGEIKGYFNIVPQTLEATVEPVSELYSYGKPYAAVYRVTVRGQGLDQNQLFVKGDNAVRFNLSVEGDCSGNNISDRSLNSYEATAHPVLGYRYLEDGTGKAAVLNPRNISFLWEGPICSKIGQYQLKIEEYVRDTHKKDEQELYSKTISLPESSVPELSSTSYKLEVETANPATASVPTLACYPNGVSATPFKVVIKDGDGKILPSTDDAYNHLFFYVSDSTTKGILPDDCIIGCNPYDELSNDIAILPAQMDAPGQESESVMIDGMIKYGPKPVVFPDQGGRVFYLTAGSEVNTNWNVGVGFVFTNNGTVYEKDSHLLLNTLDPAISSTPSGSDPQDLNTGERAFTLPADVSSWEGTDNGDYSGYLDYVLRDTADRDSQGIYAIFPQGLNTLDSDHRYDPAAMQIGYYFHPDGNSDGLHADQYKIDDKTSYCDALRKKTLHALLFDRYGRHADYKVGDRNVMSSLWKTPIHDHYTHIRLTNWSNVPICVHGSCNDGQNYIGVSGHDKGVFLPPDPAHDSGGYTFITKYCADDIGVDHNRKSLYLYGDQLCTPMTDANHYDYFKTELQYSYLDAAFATGGDYSLLKLYYSIPDGLKNLSADGNDANMYLPLSQVYLYDDGHMNLEFWGIHFVEWDRACDCGQFGIEKQNHNYYKGKSDSHKLWLYSLQGAYAAEPKDSSAGYDENKIMYENIEPLILNYSNLIHDDSIEGKSDGVLQIADATPDRHKLTSK